MREHYGRGPIGAKTYAFDDILICVLRGSGFTPLEQTMMDSGDGGSVVAMRENFQENEPSPTQAEARARSRHVITGPPGWGHTRSRAGSPTRSSRRRLGGARPRSAAQGRSTAAPDLSGTVIGDYDRPPDPLPGARAHRSSPPDARRSS